MVFVVVHCVHVDPMDRDQGRGRFDPFQVHHYIKVFFFSSSSLNKLMMLQNVLRNNLRLFCSFY